MAGEVREGVPAGNVVRTLKLRRTHFCGRARGECSDRLIKGQGTAIARRLRDLGKTGNLIDEFRPPGLGPVAQDDVESFRALADLKVCPYGQVRKRNPVAAKAVN